MWKTIAFVGLIVALFLLTMALVNCNQEETLPTGTVAPEPLTMAGSLPASTVTEGDSTKGWISWEQKGNIMQGEITAGAEGYFGIACYIGPMNSPKLQTLVGSGAVAHLRKGDEVTLETEIGCEKKNQCDFFFGLMKARRNGAYSEAERIAGTYVDGEECPKEDGCVAPKAPKCEFGPPVYNAKTCEWTCPSCVEKPCPPLHTWHQPSCSCILTGCTSIPEPPQCEFGPPVYDPVTCTWSCPPCDIVCEPGSHMHPRECKCYCNPVGEPECPEQTWDENKCEWVGECPCVPTECELGYLFDEGLCKCVPGPICHVSNKGTDQDWNLQESQKTVNPGHLGHLDNCPPDYLGVCDGRSASWTSNMCPN